MVTGGAALLGGVLLSRRAGGDTRRTAARAAWLSGFVLIATTVSLLA